LTQNFVESKTIEGQRAVGFFWVHDLRGLLLAVDCYRDQRAQIYF
jgi:hypothetical protein